LCITDETPSPFVAEVTKKGEDGRHPGVAKKPAKDDVAALQGVGLLALL
jgi:hypothetical protein